MFHKRKPGFCALYACACAYVGCNMLTAVMAVDVLYHFSSGIITW